MSHAQPVERIPSYIAKEHYGLIATLLQHRTGYRVATDADCNCEEDLLEIRKGQGGDWAPISSYHPYYAVGDFNGDGENDLAVVLINSSNTKRLLVVFDGPFRPGQSPAYVSSKYVEMLFYGPPRPKPWRLVIGQFGSEGALLAPQGKGYVIDDKQ